MLTLEQYKIIQEEVNKESAQEFVEKMITIYASSAERTNEILSLITTITQNQINRERDTIYKYQLATDGLVSKTLSKGKKVNKKDDFIIMTHTCRALFPWSECTDVYSINEREYFKNYLCMVSDLDVFDYSNADDPLWGWLDVTDNKEWMIKLIQKNIDENFRKG